MLSFTGSLKVFLCLEAVDMRSGFERLHAAVCDRLKEDVRGGALFVFTNRRRTRIKVLYFDGTGLWMLTNSHAPQCAFWFVLEDFLSISPAVRERLRDVRLCRRGTGHGLCAFG